MRRALSFLSCLLLVAGTAAAQTPPTEAVKGMVGAWELSNADYDKTCTVSFTAAPAGSGYGVAFDAACSTLFPPIRDVASWSFGKRDVLLLNDAKGQTVLELLEVEAGTYEGLRPNEGRYVLQNAAVAAASRDRSADQMFGEWGFVRGAGNPICLSTLENFAADADSFALTLKPGCDAAIMRFNPAAWRMERGQLLVLSKAGEAWRFEETEPDTWRRIPEARPAIILVRQK